MRIQSIERVHDQQFYGMSVAEHHNLVANGIVVKNCYQEQIMRILNRLGGIELSSAYACIKAISKKKHDIIEQRKAEFLEGAQQRGVSGEVARDIFDKIVFFGGYGFNKCVVGNTRLIDARTGERTTVGKLFRDRRPFSVHALGEDHKLTPRAVENVVWNGCKPVFEVRTRQGRVIRATDNHPFRTLDGWTLLRDLRSGDRVATPRHLRVEKGDHWPRHEIIVLADLLAEGNTCHPTCLYFFNNDPTLIQDFVEAVSCFPETKTRVYTRQGGARMEVCVNTGRDTRFSRGPRVGAATGSASGSAVGTPPTRSGAYRWAEKLGLLGVKAVHKRIPAEVFLLCDEDLELFLGRLWAGDGFLANKNLAVPYYATSSPGLAEDVQTLLLRLGILSGVHRKEFKYRSQLREGFTVHLLGEGSIEAFLACVAPHCLGREAQVELLRRHLDETARDRTSKDTVPAAVRDWIDEERRGADLTWRELEKQSGVSMKMMIGLRRPNKRGFRRSTVARLAAFFGSRRLATLAESDIFWDEIVSVTPAGEENTYDLTVESDHNFVADGFIVHNSHTAAYAQLGYQTAYLKAHYTPEFMAALLSSEVDDGNKRDILVEHIDDARKLGVEVLPPCVNASEPDFSVVGGKIVFGLVAIKGVGRSASEEIVRARTEGGNFRDLFDLCERVDPRIVSKAAIERLIKAGALDRLGGHRAQQMMALGGAVQAAAERQQDKRLGQGSLFDVFAPGSADVPEAAATLPNVPAWPEPEKLKFEKEVLDFYFSSHPLARHATEIERYATHKAGEVKVVEAGHEITLGGLLTQIRVMTSKNPRSANARFLRCKVEDLTGAVECLMWGDEYARYKDLVAEDRILFARGRIDERSSRDEPIVILSRFLTVEQMQREGCSEVWLRMKIGEHAPYLVERIAEVLNRYPGTCPVKLVIVDAEGRRSQLKLGNQFRVNALALQPAEIELFLGQGSVKLVGSSGNGRNGR